jgi:hypothetical protein
MPLQKHSYVLAVTKLVRANHVTADNNEARDWLVPVSTSLASCWKQQSDEKTDSPALRRPKIEIV